MTRTDENLQVVQSFFNNLEKRDADAVLACFDENAWWDTPSGGPFSGRFFGHTGIGRFVKLLELAHPTGPIVTDLTLHGEADRVFAEFTWAPVSDTAPRVSTRSLTVFELVFGKIAAVREFEAGPPGLRTAS
jgi:ketosteroid isomerase-like protein